MADETQSRWPYSGSVSSATGEDLQGTLLPMCRYGPTIKGKFSLMCHAPNPGRLS
jgi:hypothetical protein